MGTGISAAIPIGMMQDSDDVRMTKKNKYLPDNFFESYTFDEEDKIYIIKPELLLGNYLPFLAEFYDCIGEKYDAETMPNVSTYDEFEAAFDHTARGGHEPYLENYTRSFSILGGECIKYWLFYHGSYKAYLETYRTLLHFERTLAKALKNPLANLVKFGIFG